MRLRNTISYVRHVASWTWQDFLQIINDCGGMIFYAVMMILVCIALSSPVHIVP